MGLVRSFPNILTLFVPFDTQKTQTIIIGTQTLIYKGFHALRKV